MMAMSSGKGVYTQFRTVPRALKNPNYKFRTLQGLADDSGLPLEVIREIVEANRDKIRISPIPDIHGRTLYALREGVIVNPTTQQLGELIKQILAAFNVEELRDLCVELGIDYEGLGGDGKNGKVRELVLYCQRTGKLGELIKQLRANRPNLPLNEW